MATTHSKRTSRAKSPAKAGSTPEQQNADEQASVPPAAPESTATPQMEAASPAGEPPAASGTNAGEETPPTASQEGEKNNTPSQYDQASTNTPGDETVTGDGTGEALPPIDPDAGEPVTAEGVHGSDQSGVNDESAGEIPALFIRTRKPIMRRRRAGHVFTPEGHGIALSGLADDEIQALKADPTLVVEECTFPAEAED